MINLSIHLLFSLSTSWKLYILLHVNWFPPLLQVVFSCFFAYLVTFWCWIMLLLSFEGLGCLFLWILWALLWDAVFCCILESFSREIGSLCMFASSRLSAYLSLRIAVHLFVDASYIPLSGSFHFHDVLLNRVWW